MSKRLIELPGEQPLFDLVSHGRKGPARRDRLSPTQIEQIRRTVDRTPEAVVKVLPRGSNDFASVEKHFGYIGRYGKLELETDEGEKVSGRGVGRRLMEDWDLDLDKHRRKTDLAAALGRTPPKLVHKLMLSMPAGTPPEGVLAAARNFLREEFALKHRYAFVLHTDEPHPHVHAIVKAVSEDGVRLHIKKETLREWRRQFARHLREQGIAANATERAVRGESRSSKRDPIYRAERRGDSTYTRARVEAVASDLLKGRLRTEPGKSKLVETRSEVERKWKAFEDQLVEQGHADLADRTRRFVADMSPPMTGNEQIAAELLERTKEPRVQEKPSAR